MADAKTIVASTGGRFIAKDAVTQAQLWESNLLGAGDVVASVDVTGDSVPEVVTQTAEQAHVLDGQTGAVLWSSSLSSMEIVGAVRVLDVNGDGVADVYVDNGIGAKPGSDLAAAYSFIGGVPNKLWALPIDLAPTSLNSGTDTLVDLNADGIPEVILPSWDTVLVANAATGAAIATLSPPTANGNPYPQAAAIGADLDGIANKELLVVQSTAAELNQIVPGITAYAVDVAGGQGAFLWSVDAGSTDSQIASNADVASDLDGDGISEVVFSYRSSTTSDAWITQVLSGADGTVLDELAGARFEGAADLDGAAGAELVVATANGLGVYTFVGGMLAEVDTLAGVRALHLADPALESSGPMYQRLAVVPGPGGVPMLVTGEPVGSTGPYANVSSFSEIRSYVALGGAMAPLGSYTPLVGSVTGAIRADYATRPYRQIALGTSEGLVVVMDSSLQVTNGFIWINGEGLGSFVGAGSLRPPPLAEHDAAGSFVVLSSTAVGTVVADPKFASLIIPPIPRWVRKSLTSPSVVELGGANHVVGIEGSELVARRTTTGSLTASVTMPQGWMWGTPTPINVAGETAPRVGIDWRVDGTRIVQLMVDLETESIAWTAAPIDVGGFFGSSAGDIDADGTDEWFSLSSTLFRRQGDSGVSTSFGGFSQLGYALPMVASFQGTAPQLLLQAGGQGPQLVDANASLLWNSTAPEAVNGMAGTRTTCNGQPRFATPAVSSPYVRAFDGATGSLVAERAYAQGIAYPSKNAAVAAGRRPGLFSHLTSVADLGGDGPAILAGSTDGYLYALNSCTLDIIWAANLGTSLGEPIVADVDGDAGDEILVSGSNGRVYALDAAPCGAPFIFLAGSEDDIFVGPGESFEASWNPVEGATSYEIALVTPDEKPLWEPAYKPVDGTSATIDLAGALAGRPYKLVVRGITPDGAGYDGFSKTITVQDTLAPQFGLDARDGAPALLEVSASDDLALDHARVYVTPTGGETHLVEDAILRGSAQIASLEWRPSTDLWGSDVVVTVEVFDSALLSSGISVEATVTETGSVVFGPHTQYVPGDESGNDLPGGRRGESADSGCSSSSGAPGTAWGVLALAGLAAVIRRRKR